MVPKLIEQIENKSLLNHGTWDYYGNKQKDIYFGLQLIQIKSVPTNKSLSLLVQLMENSTFHHQRLHENEKVVIINHI